MRGHATVLVAVRLSVPRRLLMRSLIHLVSNGCLVKFFLRHILVVVASAFNFVAGVAQHFVVF